LTAAVEESVEMRVNKRRKKGRQTLDDNLLATPAAANIDIGTGQEAQLMAWQKAANRSMQMQWAMQIH
jgi:hypothetical protein